MKYDEAKQNMQTEKQNETKQDHSMNSEKKSFLDVCYMFEYI